MTLDQIKRVATLADDSEFATHVAEHVLGVLKSRDRAEIMRAIGKLQDVPAEDDGQPIFIALTRDEMYILATLAWFGRHEAAMLYMHNEQRRQTPEKDSK